MKNSDKYAFLGTLISAILTLLILFFVYLPDAVMAEDEEGMLISFGNAADGSGFDSQTMTVSESSSKTVKEMTEDDLLTQDEPSVAVVEKKKNKEDEIIRKEDARITAERLKREQDAIKKASAIDGMFGSNASGGSGNSSGNGQEGNPAGRGSQGGNSWSLDGRDLSGDLIKPSYESNEEGKVTVQIQVDQTGKVIGASITSNTTISDLKTRNAAKAAALKTRFTPGSGIAKGTITYYFKLK